MSLDREREQERKRIQKVCILVSDVIFPVMYYESAIKTCYSK